MLRVFFLLILCSPTIVQAQCPVVNLGSDTMICTGSSIILDAGNPGATYLWSDGSTSAQINPFFEGEYAVDVTLNGCTKSDTIYVQHGAIVYAEFSQTQTSSCSPLMVAFSQNSQTCSGSITSWNWDFGDGSSSTEINPVHPYAAPGNYLVKLLVTTSGGSSYTAQNNIVVTGSIGPALDLGGDVALCQGEQVTLDAGNPGSTYIWSNGATSATIDVFTAGKYSVAVSKNGCTVYDTVNVTVTPLLWNDFAFSKLADCSPVTYQFTDKSRTCNRTIETWFWEFGDGTFSNDQNPSHDYYNSGQYNVRLTITDNEGNTSRRTKKVTVAVTALNVNIGNDTTICMGSSVLLSAAQSGATYLWNTGATTASIPVNTQGTYSVAVTKNACTIKDTIRINTAISVAAGFSHNAGAACLPVRVQFNDSSKAFCNQQITSWLWEFGDGTVSTEQNPVHEYFTADSFLVKLTTTVSNGAQSTTTTKVAVANSIHVMNLSKRMVVCKEDSFQLDAGVNADEYHWTPAVHMDNAASATPKVKPVRNGWYKVDTKKCLTTVSDSIYVVVDSVSKPVITQEGNILRVKKGTAYEWYYENIRLPNGNGNNIRIDRNGYYRVKLYNQNGCSAFSDPTFFMPAPRKTDEADDIIVKCTPNPTTGPFNIILSEVPVKPLKMIIYDRYGRALLTVILTKHVTHVVLPNVSRGMYYAETTINNRKRVIPVVVQ